MPYQCLQAELACSIPLLNSIFSIHVIVFIVFDQLALKFAELIAHMDSNGIDPAGTLKLGVSS
jgi:hypothetical protein